MWHIMERANMCAIKVTEREERKLGRNICKGIRNPYASKLIKDTNQWFENISEPQKGYIQIPKKQN